MNPQATLRKIVMLATLGLAPHMAHAEPPEPPHKKALEGKLFPPHELIRHSSELGLTQDQRDKIKAAIKKAQDTSLDLQFKLQEEANALYTMLDGDKGDLTKALAQADKVIALEQEVKKTQLTLMITVKKHPTKKQVNNVRDNIQKKVSKCVT